MTPPLFVPLRTEYFRAFERGEKRAEWRAYGPRWNERTCWVGRDVTLSLGYSGARISARITGFDVHRGADLGSTIYHGDTLVAVISLDIATEEDRHASVNGNARHQSA